MKESVLDILIYLFENYFDGELDDGFEPDRDTLTQELEHAGFPTAEVERALAWLEELASDPNRPGPASNGRATRIFDTLEQLKRMGRSLIYTSHYMEEVERLADHIVIIDHGKVLADESPAALHRRLPAQAALLKAAARLRRHSEQ